MNQLLEYIKIIVLDDYFFFFGFLCLNGFFVLDIIVCSSYSKGACAIETNDAIMNKPNTRPNVKPHGGHLGYIASTEIRNPSKPNSNKELFSGATLNIFTPLFYLLLQYTVSSIYIFR